MIDITADEAREMLARAKAGSLTVLDVRQDWEYEQLHLPGAVWIPISELVDRLKEVDPEKPVVAYCHSGVRSRAAAQLLDSQGYAHVHNLLGGVMAWEGEAAFGPIEMGLHALMGATTAQDLLLVAYGMEGFLQRFYRHMEERAVSDETKTVYARLAGFEDHHQNVIFERYSRTKGTMDRESFGKAAGSVMAEGGVDPDLFVAENGATLDSVLDIVSMAMMFEAQAMDFYMRASRLDENRELEEMLTSLAREEQAHLKVLASFLSKQAQD